MSVCNAILRKETYIQTFNVCSMAILYILALQMDKYLRDILYLMNLTVMLIRKIDIIKSAR